MNICVFVSITVLSIAVIILLTDRIIIGRSLNSISSQLEEILTGDTNTLLSVTSGHGSIKKFCIMLNRKLETIRKKELEIRNQSSELSDAIVNIAHDLRTPLTAISGYLEMLETKKLDAESARCVNIIRERTTALRSLAEEFFRFTIITSDKSEMKKEEVSLKSELETALAASYTLLTDKKIEPEIVLPNEPVKRELDREALQRIFGNILSNAAKYSDGDLLISLDINGTIIFSNTASSLSGVQIGRLFDRFYTVSNARTSTGLGLSIAKILTERMKGTISAEYSDNKVIIKLKF